MKIKSKANQLPCSIISMTFLLLCAIAQIVIIPTSGEMAVESNIGVGKKVSLSVCSTSQPPVQALDHSFCILYQHASNLCRGLKPALASLANVCFESD